MWHESERTRCRIAPTRRATAVLVALVGLIGGCGTPDDLEPTIEFTTVLFDVLQESEVDPSAEVEKLPKPQSPVLVAELAPGRIDLADPIQIALPAVCPSGVTISSTMSCPAGTRTGPHMGTVMWVRA